MSASDQTDRQPAMNEWDEPVFAAEPLQSDEPYFPPAAPAPVDEPVFAPGQAEMQEPVFEAVPAQAHGVALPKDAPHSQVGWDFAPGHDAPLPVARRLGRSLPNWAIGAVLGLLVLVALWFALADDDAQENADATQPAAGVVGSLQLGEAAAPEPPAEATPLPPTATPESRLAEGMRVVVANTNGQGIRLRSAPGTAALTLGIYNDGAPFQILSPGGDYPAYPVEADGYLWYRIRVVDDPADQLVGWAAGDFLVVGE